MKISMRTRLLAFAAVAALLACLALAHGDKKHVVGTVEKITSGSVVVKTAAGKSVEVQLGPSTNYMARVGGEDKPAKVSDLAVGDRVVIHATPKGETLEADEVKFSPPAASGAGAKRQP